VAGGGRARWRDEWAALGRQELLGCGAGDGLRQELGQKEKEEGGGKRKGFPFSKPFKQMNSNKSLNSNTQNNAPACMQQ
jgi:hypothetical protein